MHDNSTRNLEIIEETGTFYFLVASDRPELKRELEEDTKALKVSLSLSLPHSTKDKVSIVTIPLGLEGNPVLIAFPGAFWFTKDTLKSSKLIVEDVIQHSKDTGSILSSESGPRKVHMAVVTEKEEGEVVLLCT